MTRTTEDYTHYTDMINHVSVLNNGDLLIERLKKTYDMLDEIQGVEKQLSLDELMLNSVIIMAFRCVQDKLEDIMDMLKFNNKSEAQDELDCVIKDECAKSLITIKLYHQLVVKKLIGKEVPIVTDTIQ